MSAAEQMIDLPETPEADIRRLVEQQKKAHIAEGPMTAERRIDLIDRCIAILVENKDAIVDALNADFGNRSPEGILGNRCGHDNRRAEIFKEECSQMDESVQASLNVPLGAFGCQHTR